MLNAGLYRSVSETFPDVQVYHEDDPGRYARKITKKKVDGYQRHYVDYIYQKDGSRGETYRVNCPFCGDTKSRMYISYLFAQYDLDARVRNWGNVHCFHHECHRDKDNIRSLMGMLDIDLGGCEIVARRVDFSESRELNLSEVREIGLPGLCQPVHELDWQHPAANYLSGRGLNVQYLGEQFGVQYLSRGYRFQALDNRLLVPFFRKGSLVGWSARVIGRLEKSFDAPPKWLHSPGSMSGILYGLGGALQCPVAVAVEGPIDKWAVGRPAFALLGKSFGAEKQARVKQMAAISPCQLFIVLLDPTQDAEAVKRGQEHHSVVMTRTLAAIVGQPVIDVRLPVHMDPGCAEPHFLAKYLYQAVRKSGHANLAEPLAGTILRTSASLGGLSADSQEL